MFARGQKPVKHRIMASSPSPARISAAAPHHFRYYDLVMAAFVAVLLLSNIIGASKLSEVSGFVFGAGILFFPISYVLGDVLTEVYGYARARRVIWVGFAALIFLAVMSLAVVAMPASPGWWCGGADTLTLRSGSDDGTGAVCQATYESVFGSTWRIVLASILAFWAGEFVNSIVMARMKLWTQGRMLWTRTIGSTVVGQGVDSLIFYPVAFLGIWSTEQVIAVMLTNWALKVAWALMCSTRAPISPPFARGSKGRHGHHLGIAAAPTVQNRRHLRNRPVKGRIARLFRAHLVCLGTIVLARTRRLAACLGRGAGAGSWCRMA
jgi:queuosine precursor transporter